MAYIDDIRKAANANLPWEKLQGCNLLVTGATGLIGSCLIEILMSHPSKSYQIYACGRNEDRAQQRFSSYVNDSSFHFFHYDVMESLTGEVNFQYIIHAASYASPNFFANHPVEVIKANVEGVGHLVDYGLKHELKRLLYVSTGEVYGEGDGRNFTEDYGGYVNPMSPRSCYPSSKRAAETMCVSYAQEYGIEAVVARPSHTYGPGFTEADNRVYAQFIRNALRGEDIVMKSSGSQFRSWCYVVDCALALLYILLKGENCEAYNVADDQSNISIRDLAEMVAGLAGRKVVFDLPSDEERKGFNIVTKSTFSTAKLAALGWTVEGSMRDKMKNVIEAARINN